MRVIYLEKRYPSLCGCLSFMQMSSQEYSNVEVSILKEHLLAHSAPRRAMMATVRQRRFEGFVPYLQKRWYAGNGRIQHPEVSQLDTFIIDMLRRSKDTLVRVLGFVHKLF